MDNVDMGKNLKTLPIMVINIWVNILPMALLRRVPPGDKTFSIFQKGGLPAQNLKPPVPLPTPIKCKVKTIGPLSGSAPQSPSGG